MKSIERPRYPVKDSYPIVGFGHVVVLEAIKKEPYYLTELDAQLGSYPDRPDIQDDIIDAFERGEAYGE